MVILAGDYHYWRDLLPGLGRHSHRPMNRRDKCHLTGKRAGRLSGRAAAAAWYLMAGGLEDLGQKDMPKFADLLAQIRGATIAARFSEKAIHGPKAGKILTTDGKE